MDGQYSKGIGVQRSASWFIQKVYAISTMGSAIDFVIDVLQVQVLYCVSWKMCSKSADHLEFKNGLIHLKNGGLSYPQEKIRESKK